MSLLKKLFGGGQDIGALRKAIEQKRYADARYIAEKLQGSANSPEEAAEIDGLLVVAGDALARLNLDEALGMQRCGDFFTAREHLALALQQVCSVEVRQEIEQAMNAGPADDRRNAAAVSVLSSQCPCSPQPDKGIDGSAPEHREIRLELVLTSYPTELAERYLKKSTAFQDALLLSHEGEGEQALDLWQRIDAPEQDDLYWYELGALQGRNGLLEDARQSLERARALSPNSPLTVDCLVPVLVALKDFPAAETCLLDLLDRGGDVAFCHARLAELHARNNNPDAAEQQAGLALQAGFAEPEFIVLAASILERNGKLDDAEQVLQKLSGAGCKGGINLPLAEFWLRRKKELGKALDTFNAACRQDPENPRWQLRVAQTYLARNWRKDGLKLLRKVINDPRLEPELAREAERLMTEGAE